MYTNHLLFSITTLQRSPKPRWFLLDLAQLFAYSWPLGLLRVVQLQLLLSAKINKVLINTKPAFNDLAFNLILNNLLNFKLRTFLNFTPLGNK